MTDPLALAEQVYFRHKSIGIVGNPRPMLAEVLALASRCLYEEFVSDAAVRVCQLFPGATHATLVAAAEAIQAAIDNAPPTSGEGE